MGSKDVFNISFLTGLEPRLKLEARSARYYLVAKAPPRTSFLFKHHLVLHQTTLQITAYEPSNAYFANLYVITALTPDGAMMVGNLQTSVQPRHVKTDFQRSDIRIRDFTFEPPLDLECKGGRATQIRNNPFPPFFGGLDSQTAIPSATGGTAVPAVGDLVLAVANYGDEETPANPIGDVIVWCGVRYSVATTLDLGFPGAA